MKSKIHILVVDDEEMMRNLLLKILTRDGYAVTVAENGNEALARVRANKIDLIICDVKMPRMSGFELLKVIKVEFPHINMIMMTASGDTYIVKDALLLGADEYITKPFKSHEISLVVERAYWRILSGIPASKPKVVET
ncbi:MAG: response regulator [candidate division Zixibacteria bacterium]|nr:response regulator [candidate division Zixibacteria bacterium]